MKKVAIIDDDSNILDVLERYLKRKNLVEVETFTNAKMAIPKIKSGNYDLVLLDIMMPEVNGLDLLVEIKNLNQNQKIIMITAHSTEAKIIKSDVTGACDYITKPFISLRDVENKIFDALGI